MLSFVHCTNVDDPSSSDKPPIEGEGNEPPSVTISTSFLSVAEGSSAKTYMISLATDALPSSGENVVINLSTNHALLAVDPSQLTLDSGNPSKTVRVTRVDNDIDENHRLIGTISHSLDSSTGDSYNIDSVRDAVDNTDITVIMSDDDTAGFIVTPVNREVNVTEGMQVGYTVQLSSEPTGDVTLNVNPTTGLSGNVASLTFTPSNWNATQRMTITADDNNYIGDYTAQVNHGVSSADSKYSSIAPGQVTVNVIDDDGGTGSIVISTDMLAFDDTDGTIGSTYTISLSHDPAPGKTVRVGLSNGNNTLQVSPTVVIFGGATGRSPQTISVRRAGGASGMIMADISVGISHTIATGVSYDPNITTFANPGGTVNVTINRTAVAPSVTISTSSLIVAEGSSAETYMISLATNVLPPRGENVVINLSTNHALLTVNPSQLTLDSSNPSKIVTVTRVNNDIDENNRLMGTISHSLDSSTGALYNINSVRNAIRQSNITVTMNDDDTAGFIFTPANREVNVTEGMQVNYTVQLSSEPTGDVTLNVNPATGLSGNAASLTFTSINWNATQRVMITADDNNYIGDYTAQVNHGVSSADSKYSSIAPGQMTVNVTDDDGGTGNIVISTNMLAFNDTDGATGSTYTISLSHDPAPGKTVRVRLSSGNSTLQISPTVVNFGGATGRSPQTITVRRAGGASGMIMADISSIIFHRIATGVSYDPNITTFANPGGIVSVTINHTAAPSVTISTSSLIVAEGGSAETYIISLEANGLPPRGENVVINLSTNHALLTVAPSQLTLDSSNPSKIVTVTRVNNDIDENNRLMGTISHSLDSSTGASYNINSVRNAVRQSNITVTMNDDDTAGFIFTPANREVNVTEGMQVNYTVQLSSEPTGDVTLNVNPATGLSGNVASLTFTSINWNTTQRMTITADDNNYVGGYTAQVNHGVSSADSKYSSIAPGQMTVNVTDDDGGTGNIVISTNMLAFNDTDGATGGTYTLSLSHDPAPGKTVRVSLSSGNRILQVSPTVITFGGARGRSPQTITVTRAGGASGMIMADISVAISHTIATGVSYDPNIATFANPGGIINVTINSTTSAVTVPVVDSDHDGLIDIDTAIKLNNMRYDLAGTSYKTSATQTTGDSSGCPASGCNGYELTADIDLLSLLDKNGNQMIDTSTVNIDKNVDGDTTDAGEQVNVINTTVDTSWVPIGDNSTDSDATRFTGIFEGNNHTIENLWVNVSNSNTYTYLKADGTSSSSPTVVAGLFGMTDGTVTIRNVGVTSGFIYSSTSSSPLSGGLVGVANSSLAIINSYFSGSGGISSSSSTLSESYSGGLVGFSFSSGDSLTITNSYFSGSGGVSSDGSIGSVSGGLVGIASSLTITNSYFSGSGGVSSDNGGFLSISGGLVGLASSLTITSSYFGGSGSISSDNGFILKVSGGFTGFATTMTTTNSYWNTDAPQNVAGLLQSTPLANGNDPMSTSNGLTLTQLKSITVSTTSAPSPSGLPHSATDNTKAWNLGTTSELPAVKLCVPTVDTSTTPPTTDWTMCASYGALLAGQR